MMDTDPIIRLIAEASDAGIRIDTFLAEELADISRSGIQHYIESGHITVNEKKIAKRYLLREGDVILCAIPEPEPYHAAPEAIPLDIVYEDEALIVIHKPQGMVVHPAPGHATGTLVNALLYHCGESLSGVNGVMRPGIVHRIDKDTSGLLVVAKTDRAHHGLARQLAAHTLQRTYHGVVWHNIPNDSFTVDAPIGRHPQDRKKMTVITKPGQKSRSAITHIAVLERFGKFTLIEAKLETGRTHQIRVHMAYKGHPLMGDPVYGSAKPLYQLNGQALHAKSLGFIHPVSHEPMFFDLDWPPYFKILIDRLRAHISDPF